MKNNNVNERLRLLREEMRREHLDAFIFPSTDPHNGEYVPEHWKGREWISGFDGSAGTAVVTMDAAALWTDSRYFIAAEQQLGGTEFVLMKERIAGTPSISKWIGMKLAGKESPEVGVDGMVNAFSSVQSLITELRAEGGITVRTNFDPLARIWKDRPEIPLNKVYIHGMEHAGETCSSKIGRLRGLLRERHTYGMLIAALDDIAWLLNLRGNDVHCNPVFVSYLLVCPEKATLYVNGEKLTQEVREYLQKEGVETDDYENVRNGLAQYDEYSILLDPCEINYTLYNSVRCQEIVSEPSPVPYMKAVKNDTEIAGFRNAMLRDGIAMVKFLRWLKPAVAAGGQTEMSVATKLETLRAGQPLYRGLSFDTISAYAEHGAIVHYEPTPETDKPLSPEGLLLLDSGAQYVDGTTDITRTIALGDTATDEQRRVYTYVLKGNLQLLMLKFPKGASGTQLDALARKDMWSQGMNYMHGTGHGVGSFLNVHEGPHQIRMEWKPAPIVAGMTVTDEPGIYLAGRFGVRIENTLLVKPYMETEFGEFLQFESLTLCPIDKSLIDKELLTEEERDMLNDYHREVYDKLAPHLDEDERAWLEEATRSIS